MTTLMQTIAMKARSLSGNQNPTQDAKPNSVGGSNSASQPTNADKSRTNTENSKSAGEKDQNKVRGNGSADPQMPWHCMKCPTTSDDTDKMVECELCQNRCCSKCLKITASKHDILTRDDLAWFCSKECKARLRELVGMKEVASQMGGIIQRLDRIEHNIHEQKDSGHKAISNEITFPEEKITNIEKQVAILTERIEENTASTRQEILSKKTYSEVTAQQVQDAVNKAIANHSAKVTAEKELAPLMIKTALEEQDKESRDREERATGLVIFGAPESTKASQTERDADDAKFITGFLEEIGTGEVSFSKVTRL
jgi:hypothetical protein